MRVWRMQKKTDGGDIGEICLKENIVAMGWQLKEDEEEFKNNCTIENYERLAYKRYKKRGYGSVIRLANADVGDIVWMRNKGKYYLARITEDSEWYYDFSQEAKNSDTVNRRANMIWHEVGDEASIPGCLSTGFISGSTFQQIKKDGIVEYSQYIYNELAIKDESYRYEKAELVLNENNFWNMLLPSDAEDLLALWLYDTKKYIVIPSTNKVSTPLYECILVDPNAEERKHIYIQVKKGDIDINANDYAELDGEVYFLSTGGEVLNLTKENHFKVDSQIIYDFATDPSKKMLIPKGIERWIEYLANAENKNIKDDNIKGIMIDTNLSYSNTNEKEMLTQNRVCAYGDSRRYINSFKKGDYALYYSKGRGIIAIGEVISDKPEQFLDGDEKGLYHDVKMIIPQTIDIEHIYDKFISAREIKQELNRGFYFRSTIKTPYLNKKQVEILIDKLKEKYGEK